MYIKATCPQTQYKSQWVWLCVCVLEKESMSKKLRGMSREKDKLPCCFQESGLWGRRQATTCGTSYHKQHTTDHKHGTSTYKRLSQCVVDGGIHRNRVLWKCSLHMLKKKKSFWRLKVPQDDNDIVLKDTSASATFVYMLYKIVTCIHDRRHHYSKLLHLFQWQNTPFAVILHLCITIF